MIDEEPFVKILLAGKAALALGTWEVETGIAVGVRHYRHRKTGQDERPCVSIMFVSDGPPEEDTPQTSHDEKWMQSEWQLIVDHELRTEDSNTDETGLAELGRIAAYALRLLKDPAGPLFAMVHEIVDGAKVLDESSQPDKARFTRAISILYRVRADDENELL
jgi:hypothetical protein